MTGRRLTLERVRNIAATKTRPGLLPSWLPYWQYLSTREALIQFLLTTFLTLIVVFIAFPAPVDYQEGNVADYTIRAERNFSFPDQIGTNLNRQTAATAAAPVFILDDLIPRFLEEEAKKLFHQGRELIANLPSHASLQAQNSYLSELAKLQKKFQTFFRLPEETLLWPKLVKSRFDKLLEKQAVNLAMEIMSHGFLEGRKPFGPSYNNHQPATIIILSSHAEYKVPMATLFDQEQKNQLINTRSRRLTANFNPDQIQIILALAQGLAQPNLKVDWPETEKRLAEATNSIEELYLNIHSGDIIIREGEVIDSEALAKIKATCTDQNYLSNRPGHFCGLFLVLFLFYNSTLILAHFSPRNNFKPIIISEQIFLAIFLIIATLLAHFSIVFSVSLSWNFQFINNRTLFYALPLPAATMLTAIFFNLRKAAIMALFISVTAAVAVPGDSNRFTILLYCYNGAIATTWHLWNMNERSHLIPASLWVIIMNCLTVLSLNIFSDVGWNRQALYNFAAAIFSGAFSGILASGLIPLIELTFGFNTNLKLMELSNLDRPILRELMLSAPGTYHHSVIVGTMVEATAEAIRANPYLAKVGAYYHDIGKIKKPLYFVENQTGENRHDTLAPSMSALILVGHIREGKELARCNRLPKNVVAIVEQHHGTSLMGFFYHKAKEQCQEGQPEVNESDYRYPGPKPLSKEAGLVMLGDICEAATRSLSEPTPAKIRNLVQYLVSQVFNDGQLDNCNLKTSEIPILINTFTNILVGIYHHRVSYPGSKKTCPSLKAGS